MTDRTRSALPPAPLSVHRWDEVGCELRAMLVELLRLSRTGNKLPWSVVQPLYWPVLEQFDELVELWRELGDTVAEPAGENSFMPAGQTAVMASRSMLDQHLSKVRAQLELEHSTRIGTGRHGVNGGRLG